MSAFEPTVQEASSPQRRFPSMPTAGSLPTGSTPRTGRKWRTSVSSRSSMGSLAGSDRRDGAAFYHALDDAYGRSTMVVVVPSFVDRD